MRSVAKSAFMSTVDHWPKRKALGAFAAISQLTLWTSSQIFIDSLLMAVQIPSTYNWGSAKCISREVTYLVHNESWAMRITEIFRRILRHVDIMATNESSCRKYFFFFSGEDTSAPAVRIFLDSTQPTIFFSAFVPFD